MALKCPCKNASSTSQEPKDQTFASYTTNLSTPSIEESEISEPDETVSYISETSWPDVEIPGSWGLYGLEENPWCDESKPFVKIRTFEELELNEDEKNGILSERMVACCSSYMDRSPIVGKYVLCKTDLSEKSLEDISVLTFHHYLQYVNLSNNKLIDLKPLGELPYLMYLDVSHNLLTQVLNFKPPFNLTYVNYSYNLVDVIDDLTDFWSMIYLDLSHNQIYYIKGLEKLKYLRYLDLSYNQIKELRNLNNMRLVNLDLSNNRIDKVIIDDENGLHNLKNLVSIDLSNNKLRSFKLFKNVDAIQKIIMTGNQVLHLIELEYIKNLRFLIEIDFRDNPICKQKRYYEMCIQLVKPLILLDGAYISSEEKVLVYSKHEPPPQIDAARQRSNLFLLEKLMKHDLVTNTLPISKPAPPIIVLVGPQGSGQRTLLKQFSEKYQKYLKVAVSHTNRPKRDSENEGVDYYFVGDDEFKKMLKEGQFMTVSEYMGYSYGLHRDEIVKVYNKKLVLMFHTDLVSALVLRMRSLKPILVLTICFEEEKHYERLINRICCIKWKSFFRDNRNFYRISPIGVPQDEESEEEEEEEEEELLDTATLKECYEDIVNYLPIQEKTLVINERTTTISDSTQSSNSPTKQLYQVEEEYDKTDNAARSVSEEIGPDRPNLSALSGHFFQDDDDDITTPTTSLGNPERNLEKFIEDVMENRRKYLDFHQENPGFFLSVVFTDQPEEAMKTLKGILKYQVERKKEPSFAYSYEADPCFEAMLTERLNVLYSDMYGEMFVSEDQQPKCWKKHIVHDLDK
nr:leucine-rich repeat and guanylate kinase domain-containing protein-like [Onthophagus taurus]